MYPKNWSIDTLLSLSAENERLLIQVNNLLTDGEFPLLALIQALESEDVVDRKNAAFVLGEIADPATILPLVKTFKDSDAEVRSAGSDALVKMGSFAIPYLNFYLKNKSPKIRFRTVVIFGRINIPEIAPYLLQVIKTDESENIRSVALRFLGELKNISMTDDLLEALNDPSPEVRQNVIYTLAKTGDLKALPALIELQKNDLSEVAGGWGSTIKEAATKAISSIRNQNNTMFPQA